MRTKKQKVATNRNFAKMQLMGWDTNLDKIIKNENLSSEEITYMRKWKIHIKYLMNDWDCITKNILKNIKNDNTGI